MPTFNYKAFDHEGRDISGTLEALSSSDAKRQLELQGLRVESVTEISPTVSAASSDSAREEPAFALHKKELSAITTEVAGLAKAQLPLATGLAVLAEELPAGRLRRGMLGFARKLESGMSLEDVYASYGAPSELRAIVHSGIRAGHVEDALAEYVAHRRNQSTVKLRIFLSLGYPIAIFIFSQCIICFFLFYVVPTFKKTLMDFETELPAITEWLLAFTDFMMEVGWKFLAGFTIVLLLFLLAIFLILRSGKWHSLFRWVPIIGPIWHWSGMSRFCHLLAVLIENRLPLPEAIVLAGNGVGDAGIRKACRDLAKRITTGESLERPPQSLHGFPSALIEVVTEYKQTEALPEALHAIGDMFEGRTRLQSNFVAAIFGPLIIMASGFILGFIVVALFMPLIKLLNDLS